MEYIAKTPEYKEASRHRVQFLKDHIINFQTNFYKSQVERDWAYICKREYNYSVVLKSSFYSFFVANLVWSHRIFHAKKMVYWPLAITAVAYPFFRDHFLFKVNKRLFDMCNVGEEYELGRARNEVLKICNELQNVEDF